MYELTFDTNLVANGRQDALVVVSVKPSQDFGEAHLHGSAEVKQDDVHHLQICKAVWMKI